jgi:hypothetical protein
MAGRGTDERGESCGMAMSRSSPRKHGSGALNRRKWSAEGRGILFRMPTLAQKGLASSDARRDLFGASFGAPLPGYFSGTP